MEDKNENKMRLNWDKIIESDGNTTNKGTKFEDLIEKLLIAMYGKKVWRRTQASHDGKKDFAAPYEDLGRDTHWAECKNYDVRISINTLSPTLVMSAIDNVPNIIFFSFSELNKNAYNYTSKFASLYNKKIIVYDGNLLENLIYLYKDSIKDIEKFFPDINWRKFDFIEGENTYKLYKFLRSFDGKSIISKKHKFEMGEKFRYVIVIHNIFPATLNISVDTSLYEKNIRIKPVSLNKQILFGEMSEISFECEVITPKISFTIPSVEIVINNRKIVIQKLSGLQSIPVPYCFFCGSSHYEVLNTITNMLIEGTNAPIIIEGPSGVGKTTIINNILNNSTLSSKYQPICFDGDEKADNVYNIIKDLLFQMIGIKYFSDSEYVDELEETYLLNSFCTDKSLDIFRIVDAIIKLSKRCNILFFIDNTNKLNPQLVRIFNILFIEVSNHNLWSKISFVLTVNTSVSSVNDILALLNIGEIYADFNVKQLSLKEFTKDDAILYFEAKYGLRDVSLCFDDKDETYLPLFLDYFFKYMVDNEIVILNNKQDYVINKPIEFRLNINRLNKSDTEILKNQEVFLFTQYNHFKSEIEQILKLLLLLDEIDLNKFLWLNKKAIQILSNYNIIKEKNKILMFRHSKIYLYYNRTIIPTSKDYADIFYELQQISKDDFAAEKIICIFASNGFELLQGCHQVLSVFFASNPVELSYDKVYAVCNAMIKWLKCVDESPYISNTVAYLKNSLKPLTNHMGRETILSIYTDIINVFMDDKFLKQDTIQNDIAFIFKKFLDLLLSNHENSKCKMYVEKFCAKIKYFKGLSIAEQNKWLAHYYNRLAIAIDRNSIPFSNGSDASKYYEKSKKYAEQTSDNRLKEQIAIDEFNRHYYYIQDLNEKDICNLSDFYKDYMSSSTENDLKIKFHLYLTDFLQKKEYHIKDIDTILQDINPLCSSFYVSKLRMLKIYSFLDKHETENLSDEIDNLLKNIYSVQLRHLIYKVTYIKAQYSKLKFGDTNQTLDLFVRAYKQLDDTMKNDAEKYRNIFLYRELLIYIYSQNKDIANSLVENCIVARDVLNVLLDKKTSCKDKRRFFVDSKFIFNGINYPNI